MRLFLLGKFTNHFLNVKSNHKISSEDVSNDFWKGKKCFDLSKYPNEYEYFDETSKRSHWKVQRWSKRWNNRWFSELCYFSSTQKVKAYLCTAKVIYEYQHIFSFCIYFSTWFYLFLFVCSFVWYFQDSDSLFSSLAFHSIFLTFWLTFFLQ